MSDAERLRPGQPGFQKHQSCRDISEILALFKMFSHSIRYALLVIPYKGQGHRNGPDATLQQRQEQVRDLWQGCKW